MIKQNCNPLEGCGQPNLFFRPFGGFNDLTPPPPANLVAPVVSGLISVGSTLTTTNGTWDGSPTFTYQWRRNGVPIVGSTNFNRILIGSDLGAMIDVVVTGTSANGSSAAVSNAVGPITI